MNDGKHATDGSLLPPYLWTTDGASDDADTTDICYDDRYRYRKVYDYDRTGSNAPKGLDLGSMPDWYVSDWIQGTKDKIVPIKFRGRFIIGIIVALLIVHTCVYPLVIDMMDQTNSDSITEALSRLSDLDSSLRTMYGVGIGFSTLFIVLCIIGRPDRRRAPRGMVAVSADRLESLLNADKIIARGMSGIRQYGSRHTSFCRMIAWDPASSGFWMLFWSPRPSDGSMFSDAGSSNGLTRIYSVLLKGRVGSAIADAEEWPMWLQTDGDRVRLIVDKRYLKLTEWLQDRRGSLAAEMGNLITADDYLAQIQLPRTPKVDENIHIDRAAALLMGEGSGDPRSNV